MTMHRKLCANVGMWKKYNPLAYSGAPVPLMEPVEPVFDLDSRVSNGHDTLTKVMKRCAAIGMKNIGKLHELYDSNNHYLKIGPNTRASEFNAETIIIECGVCQSLNALNITKLDAKKHTEETIKVFRECITNAPWSQLTHERHKMAKDECLEELVSRCKEQTYPMELHLEYGELSSKQCGDMTRFVENAMYIFPNYACAVCGCGAFSGLRFEVQLNTKLIETNIYTVFGVTGVNQLVDCLMVDRPPPSHFKLLTNTYNTIMFDRLRDYVKASSRSPIYLPLRISDLFMEELRYHYQGASFVSNVPGNPPEDDIRADYLAGLCHFGYVFNTIDLRNCNEADLLAMRVNRGYTAWNQRPVGVDEQVIIGADLPYEIYRIFDLNKPAFIVTPRSNLEVAHNEGDCVLTRSDGLILIGTPSTNALLSFSERTCDVLNKYNCISYSGKTLYVSIVIQSRFFDWWYVGSEPCSFSTIVDDDQMYLEVPRFDKFDVIDQITGVAAGFTKILVDRDLLEVMLARVMADEVDYDTLVQAGIAHAQTRYSKGDMVIDFRRVKVQAVRDTALAARILATRMLIVEYTVVGLFDQDEWWAIFRNNAVSLLSCLAKDQDETISKVVSTIANLLATPTWLTTQRLTQGWTDMKLVAAQYHENKGNVFLKEEAAPVITTLCAHHTNCENDHIYTGKKCQCCHFSVADKHGGHCVCCAPDQCMHRCHHGCHGPSQHRCGSCTVCKFAAFKNCKCCGQDHCTVRCPVCSLSKMILEDEPLGDRLIVDEFSSEPGRYRQRADRLREETDDLVALQSKTKYSDREPIPVNIVSFPKTFQLMQQQQYQPQLPPLQPSSPYTAQQQRTLRKIPGFKTGNKPPTQVPLPPPSQDSGYVPPVVVPTNPSNVVGDQLTSEQEQQQQDQQHQQRDDQVKKLDTTTSQQQQQQTGHIDQQQPGSRHPEQHRDTYQQQDGDANEELVDWPGLTGHDLAFLRTLFTEDNLVSWAKGDTYLMMYGSRPKANHVVIKGVSLFEKITIKIKPSRKREDIKLIKITDDNEGDDDKCAARALSKLSGRQFDSAPTSAGLLEKFIIQNMLNVIMVFGSQAIAIKGRDGDDFGVMIHSSFLGKENEQHWRLGHVSLNRLPSQPPTPAVWLSNGTIRKIFERAGVYYDAATPSQRLVILCNALESQRQLCYERLIDIVPGFANNVVQNTTAMHSVRLGTIKVTSNAVYGDILNMLNNNLSEAKTSPTGLRDYNAPDVESDCFDPTRIIAGSVMSILTCKETLRTGCQWQTHSEHSVSAIRIQSRLYKLSTVPASLKTLDVVELQSGATTLRAVVLKVAKDILVRTEQEIPSGPLTLKVHKVSLGSAVRALVSSLTTTIDMGEFKNKLKEITVVRGGPGTGKTTYLANIVADGAVIISMMSTQVERLSQQFKNCMVVSVENAITSQLKGDQLIIDEASLVSWYSVANLILSFKRVVVCGDDAQVPAMDLFAVAGTRRVSSLLAVCMERSTNITVLKQGYRIGSPLNEELVSLGCSMSPANHTTEVVLKSITSNVSVVGAVEELCREHDITMVIVFYRRAKIMLKHLGAMTVQEAQGSEADNVLVVQYSPNVVSSGVHLDKSHVLAAASRPLRKLVWLSVNNFGSDVPLASRCEIVGEGGVSGLSTLLAKLVVSGNDVKFASALNKQERILAIRVLENYGANATFDGDTLVATVNRFFVWVEIRVSTSGTTVKGWDRHAVMSHLVTHLKWLSATTALEHTYTPGVFSDQYRMIVCLSQMAKNFQCGGSVFLYKGYEIRHVIGCSFYGSIQITDLTLFDDDPDKVMVIGAGKWQSGSSRPVSHDPEKIQFFLDAMLRTDLGNYAKTFSMIKRFLNVLRSRVKGLLDVLLDAHTGSCYRSSATMNSSLLHDDIQALNAAGYKGVRLSRSSEFDTDEMRHVVYKVDLPMFTVAGFGIPGTYTSKMLVRLTGGMQEFTDHNDVVTAILHDVMPIQGDDMEQLCKTNPMLDALVQREASRLMHERANAMPHARVPYAFKKRMDLNLKDNFRWNEIEVCADARLNYNYTNVIEGMAIAVLYKLLRHEFEFMGINGDEPSYQHLWLVRNIGHVPEAKKFLMEKTLAEIQASLKLSMDAATGQEKLKLQTNLSSAQSYKVTYKSELPDLLLGLQTSTLSIQNILDYCENRDRVFMVLPNNPEEEVCFRSHDGAWVYHGVTSVKVDGVLRTDWLALQGFRPVVLTSFMGHDLVVLYGTRSRYARQYDQYKSMHTTVLEFKHELDTLNTVVSMRTNVFKRLYNRAQYSDTTLRDLHEYYRGMASKAQYSATKISEGITTASLLEAMKTVSMVYIYTVQLSKHNKELADLYTLSKENPLVTIKNQAIQLCLSKFKDAIHDWAGLPTDMMAPLEWFIKQLGFTQANNYRLDITKRTFTTTMIYIGPTSQLKSGSSTPVLDSQTSSEVASQDSQTGKIVKISKKDARVFLKPETPPLEPKIRQPEQKRGDVKTGKREQRQKQQHEGKIEGQFGRQGRARSPLGRHINKTVPVLSKPITGTYEGINFNQGFKTFDLLEPNSSGLEALSWACQIDRATLRSDLVRRDPSLPVGLQQTQAMNWAMDKGLPLVILDQAGTFITNVQDLNSVTYKVVVLRPSMVWTVTSGRVAVVSATSRPDPSINTPTGDKTMMFARFGTWATDLKMTLTSEPSKGVNTCGIEVMSRVTGYDRDELYSDLLASNSELNKGVELADVMNWHHRLTIPYVVLLSDNTYVANVDSLATVPLKIYYSTKDRHWSWTDTPVIGTESSRDVQPEFSSDLAPGGERTLDDWDKAVPDNADHGNNIHQIDNMMKDVMGWFARTIPSTRQTKDLWQRLALKPFKLRSKWLTWPILKATTVETKILTREEWVCELEAIVLSHHYNSHIGARWRSRTMVQSLIKKMVGHIVTENFPMDQADTDNVAEMIYKKCAVALRKLVVTDVSELCKGRVVLCPIGSYGDVKPMKAIAECIAAGGEGPVVIGSASWSDLFADYDFVGQHYDEFEFFKYYSLINTDAASDPEVVINFRDMMGTQLWYIYKYLPRARSAKTVIANDCNHQCTVIMTDHPRYCRLRLQPMGKRPYDSDPSPFITKKREREIAHLALNFSLAFLGDGTDDCYPIDTSDIAAKSSVKDGQGVIAVGCTTLNESPINWKAVCQHAVKLTKQKLLVVGGFDVERELADCVEWIERFSKYEPYVDMMRRAGLVIHHGGAGAISQAWMTGVPNVAVPQNQDQKFFVSKAGSRVANWRTFLKWAALPSRPRILTPQALMRNINNVAFALRWRDVHASTPDFYYKQPDCLETHDARPDLEPVGSHITRLCDDEEARLKVMNKELHAEFKIARTNVCMNTFQPDGVVPEHVSIEVANDKTAHNILCNAMVIRLVKYNPGYRYSPKTTLYRALRSLYAGKLVGAKPLSDLEIDKELNKPDVRAAVGPYEERDLQVISTGSVVVTFFGSIGDMKPAKAYADMALAGGEKVVVAASWVYEQYFADFWFIPLGWDALNEVTTTIKMRAASTKPEDFGKLCHNWIANTQAIVMSCYRVFPLLLKAKAIINNGCNQVVSHVVYNHPNYIVTKLQPEDKNAKQIAWDVKMIMLHPNWLRISHQRVRFVLHEMDPYAVNGYPMTSEDITERSSILDGTPVVSFGSQTLVNDKHLLDLVIRVVGLTKKKILLVTNVPNEALVALLAKYTGRVSKYEPYYDMFKRASIVIHHGGMGAISAGIMTGCPMVLLPQSFDQHDNTRILEAKGVTLRPQDVIGWQAMPERRTDVSSKLMGYYGNMVTAFKVRGVNAAIPVTILHYCGADVIKREKQDGGEGQGDNADGQDGKQSGGRQSPGGDGQQDDGTKRNSGQQLRLSELTPRSQQGMKYEDMKNLPSSGDTYGHRPADKAKFFITERLPFIKEWQESRDADGNEPHDSWAGDHAVWELEARSKESQVQEPKGGERDAGQQHTGRVSQTEPPLEKAPQPSTSQTSQQPETVIQQSKPVKQQQQRAQAKTETKPVQQQPTKRQIDPTRPPGKGSGDDIMDNELMKQAMANFKAMVADANKDLTELQIAELFEPEKYRNIQPMTQQAQPVVYSGTLDLTREPTRFEWANYVAAKLVDRLTINAMRFSYSPKIAMRRKVSKVVMKLKEHNPTKDAQVLDQQVMELASNDKILKALDGYSVNNVDDLFKGSTVVTWEGSLGDMKPMRCIVDFLVGGSETVVVLASRVFASYFTDVYFVPMEFDAIAHTAIVQRSLATNPVRAASDIAAWVKSQAAYTLEQRKWYSKVKSAQTIFINHIAHIAKFIIGSHNRVITVRVQHNANPKQGKMELVLVLKQFEVSALDVYPLAVSDLVEQSSVVTGQPVVTIGSLTLVNAYNLEAMVQHICTITTHKVLLISNTNENPLFKIIGKWVARVTPYEPYFDLFRRAGVVIHHGGMGAMSMGIVTGCPQVLIPQSFDQFDNERLGLENNLIYSRDEVLQWTRLPDHSIKSSADNVTRMYKTIHKELRALAVDAVMPKYHTYDVVIKQFNIMDSEVLAHDRFIVKVSGGLHALNTRDHCVRQSFIIAMKQLKCNQERIELLKMAYDDNFQGGFRPSVEHIPALAAFAHVNVAIRRSGKWMFHKFNAMWPVVFLAIEQMTPALHCMPGKKMKITASEACGEIVYGLQPNRIGTVVVGNDDVNSIKDRIYTPGSKDNLSIASLTSYLFTSQRTAHGRVSVIVRQATQQSIVCEGAISVGYSVIYSNIVSIGVGIVTENVANVVTIQKLTQDDITPVMVIKMGRVWSPKGKINIESAKRLTALNQHTKRYMVEQLNMAAADIAVGGGDVLYVHHFDNREHHMSNEYELFYKAKTVVFTPDVPGAYQVLSQNKGAARVSLYMGALKWVVEFAPDDLTFVQSVIATLTQTPMTTTEKIINTPQAFALIKEWAQDFLKIKESRYGAELEKLRTGQYAWADLYKKLGEGTTQADQATLHTMNAKFRDGMVTLTYDKQRLGPGRQPQWWLTTRRRLSWVEQDDELHLLTRCQRVTLRLVTGTGLQNDYIFSETSHKIPLRDWVPQVDRQQRYDVIERELPKTIDQLMPDVAENYGVPEELDELLTNLYTEFPLVEWQTMNERVITSLRDAESFDLDKLINTDCSDNLVVILPKQDTMVINSTEQPTRIGKTDKLFYSDNLGTLRVQLEKASFAELNAVSTRLGAPDSYRTMQLDINEELNLFYEVYGRQDWRKLLHNFSCNKIYWDLEKTKEWLNEHHNFEAALKETKQLLREGWGTTFRLDKVSVHGKAEATCKDPLQHPKSTGLTDSSIRIIVWQRYCVAAVFSPIFLEAKKRLKTFLRPGMYYADGMTASSLAKLMSTIKDKCVFFENDLSKQDKQTDSEILKLEMELYKALGVNEQIVDMWKTTHDKWYYKGNQLWGSQVAMRLTGQVTTSIGNVLTNLNCHKRLIHRNSSRIVFGLFLGDDMLIGSTTSMDTETLHLEIKQNYNMLSKPLESFVGCFISFLICNSDQGLVMSPDLVRLRDKFVSPGIVQRPEVLNLRTMSYICLVGDTPHTRETIKAMGVRIELPTWQNIWVAAAAAARRYGLSMAEVYERYLELMGMMRCQPRRITFKHWVSDMQHRRSSGER